MNLKPLVGLILIGVAASALAQDVLRERAEGFLPLFNGYSVQGWNPGGEVPWRVVDAALVGDAEARVVESEHNAFSDYVLRFEWRVSAQGQAALLLRGREFAFGAVALADRREGSGGMDELRLRVRKRMDAPAGEWNRMEIRVQRGAAEVRLNDEVVVANTPVPNLPAQGTIGFQVTSGTLSVRCVRMKPLGLDLAFFVAKVQPTYKLQCVGCHGGTSNAGRKFPLQVPNLGTYDDGQTLRDYLESARRVRSGKPDESLLLRKALGQGHGGGKQFAPESPDHRAFLEWINGATLPAVR